MVTSAVIQAGSHVATIRTTERLTACCIDETKEPPLVADHVAFALPGSDFIEDSVQATYYIEVDGRTDIVGKAKAFAIGQTIGTWTDVPGVTPEMRRKHMGRVTNILSTPPVDLIHQVPDRVGYFIQVALPIVNFGAQMPQMLTTLLGNDASTSIQAKLVDLQLPAAFTSEFPGPRFGIAGVRDLVGVHDRPLLLNMIKPCTGLTPSQGAAIFRDTALGGVDLIKDDELLGNTEFSPVTARVRAYLEAADAAAQVTGKRAVYVPNITDRPERILDTARAAVDAGAQAVMISFAVVGYGILQALAETVGVPILAHYAGAGSYYEGGSTGMSSRIALGALPRLAGADMMMLNTPYGGYPMRRSSYLLTGHQLSLPHPQLKPTLPMVGGKVHPGLVDMFLKELGNEIVLAPGGAIQGHPQGAAAGVRAMLQAIEAAMAGVSAQTYAQDHQELDLALKAWGIRHHSDSLGDSA